MAKKATKAWYESKTVWLGIITTLIGIFSFVEASDAGMSISMAAIGILNIILRSISTTSIE